MKTLFLEDAEVFHQRERWQGFQSNVWEFPKMGDPNIVPKVVVRSLL